MTTVRHIRPSAPGLEAALANHARRIQELERTPGKWIYVGTYPADLNTSPESPPFENGWANLGGDFPPCSFYIDKHRRVHVRGAVTGGAVGTVIFTLPIGYRPDSTERIICASATAATVVIEIHSDGTVVYVA